MSRASKILIGLGLFTAIVPVLGFPGVVKDGLTVIAGLAIAAITYWAEKHAKFCPECNLPAYTPHTHTGEVKGGVGGQLQEPQERSEQPVRPFSDITPTSSNRSDIDARIPQEIAMTPPSETSRASAEPSPFSFDAETKATRKPRRTARRKEAVIS